MSADGFSSAEGHRTRPLRTILPDGGAVKDQGSPLGFHAGHDAVLRRKMLSETGCRPGAQQGWRKTEAEAYGRSWSRFEYSIGGIAR
jgi:hypothetical protein